MNRLEIIRADNGYIAEYWDESETEQIKMQVVFEEPEMEKYGEIECFQRLLYYITEYFAMTGSKHDARRIRITTGGEEC